MRKRVKVSFANTNGTFNVPVTIIDDNIAEKAERIIVKIVSSSNANVSTSNNYSIIFIKDNDYIAPIPTNELNLQLLTSFSNGAAGTNSAEIVAFDPTTDRLYIANSIGQKLDIVNFANPSAPVLLSSISMLPYGGINSIVSKNGIVAVAVENAGSFGSHRREPPAQVGERRRCVGCGLPGRKCSITIYSILLNISLIKLIL